MANWLDKYDDVPKAENGIEGTMGGLTDVGFNYNGAWGGTMQDGGYIDSVLNANKNLDWVQRLYEKNTPSIQIPGQKGRSTHFMEYSDNRVYPTVVKEKGKLKYLKDKAYDYADATKTFIKFPTEAEAKWFTENYKKGTNVLKEFQMGGGIPGAVGFTYARTGSIPSNGPYAKKTKASAQKGKTITKREDFEPWWNWASRKAGDVDKRQDAYGTLGDLYAYYAGQPLHYNALEYSEYKPTNAKNPNAKYISINDPKFKQEIFDKYNEVFIKKGTENQTFLTERERDRLKSTKINENTYAVSGYTPSNKKDYEEAKRLGIHPVYIKGKKHVSNAIGRYFISKGKDDKGEYISYYDVFDEGSGPDGGGIGETLRLTKPFEIYDRIYLDPKTGKPKMQNGGEMKYYQEGLDFKPKTISQDGTYVKKPRTDMLTMDEYRLQKALANQPQVAPSSNPVGLYEQNKKKQDKVTKLKKYADQNVMKYNDRTGTVEPIYSDNTLKKLDRAMTHFVEPALVAESVLSGAILARGLAKNLLNPRILLSEGNPAYGQYFHGSSSANIPLLLKQKGLKPFGELEKLGEAPLTGELAFGIGPQGINRTALSTVNAKNFDAALDYSLGMAGRGKVDVEKRLNDWFVGGGRDRYIDIAGESPFLPKPQTYDDIYNNRLTQLQNLSEAERKIVEENFPVLYGINPKQGVPNRLQPVSSSISGEVGISGGAGFDEFGAMFAPKKYVKDLRKMVGNQVNVLPIERVMNAARLAELKQLKYEKGGEIKKDDMGYWNPENWGEPVEIDSNEITMEGVYEPLLGISDTGDVQMMYPGEDYTFDGETVTEYPLAQDGRNILKPTSSDSLLLYKNALEKEKFYKNNPNYRILDKQGKSSKLTKSSVLSQLAKKSMEENEKFSKTNNKSRSLFTLAKDKDVLVKDIIEKTGRVPGSKIVYKVPDILWEEPDPYHNPEAPAILFSPQILPQGETLYGSNIYGDSSQIPYYDPLAVKPYKMRTPQEKIDWERKYGKPVPKPKPSLQTVDRLERSFSQTPPKIDGKKTIKQKETSYTYTVPTFDKEVQKTLYFPDEKSLKEFTDKYGYTSRSFKDKEGSATGYPQFKDGGISVNEADAQPIEKLDQSLNFTNYNKPTKGGWLDKYQ